MSDLFWPGDHRAGELFGGPALLAAMVRVEAAWLAALVDTAAAPAEARDPLAGLVDPERDTAALATAAEAGGNPVIPLVRLLRERLGSRNSAAAHWLHRGLTSQDVLDTALVLGLAEVRGRVLAELTEQAGALAGLAAEHRDTPAVARTLTQHAVPTTFGVRVAQWLTAVLDARDDLAAVTLPAQFGGAAGTLAGATAVMAAGAAHSPDDAGARAVALAARAAGALGLEPRSPWHTTRAPLTRAGDALVRCTDAWGRIANDVLTASRPEIGELSEGAGGGSSTMPHKANPVLSVLVRRAALAAPGLAAQLHLAAADARDERPDGAWHLEWASLRDLARRAVVAAGQTTELLTGLRVHPDRMRATLEAAGADVLAEARALGADPAGPEDHLGAAGPIVDAALARARARAAPVPAGAGAAGAGAAGAEGTAAHRAAPPYTARDVRQQDAVRRGSAEPGDPGAGEPGEAVRYAAGLAVRRAVLGEEHVDRVQASVTGLTADFQDFITRYAWGEVWTRPGLDRRSRSMITLTALVAGGHEEELALHLRAAQTNGLTDGEIAEVLLQAAVYCGVPRANTAFRIAQRVLAPPGSGVPDPEPPGHPS